MQAFWNQGIKNKENGFPACVGLQKNKLWPTWSVLFAVVEFSAEQFVIRQFTMGTTH